MSGAATTRRESADFLIHHILEYSQHGKSVDKQGRLVWSFSGELIGDGDGAHFRAVRRAVVSLDATGDGRSLKDGDEESKFDAEAFYNRLRGIR